MNFSAKKSVFNPEEKAGFLSKLFFHWAFPILKKGSKSELTINDLYDVINEEESEKLGNELEKQWKSTCEAAKKKGKNPSFLRALTAAHGREYILMTFLMTINQCIFKVAPSIFLRLFVKTFRDDAATLQDQIFYASSICVAMLVCNLATNYLHFTTTRIGIKCSIGTASLIFRKMLGMTLDGQNKTGVGQVINLMSNDSGEFKRTIPFTTHLIACPIQLGVYTYILWQEFGVYCLPSIALIILSLPLQHVLGTYTSRFRFQLSVRRDRRAGLMNEIICAIRVIKMYAWEKPFSALLNSIRKLEILSVKHATYLKASCTVLFNASNKALPLLTIVVYALAGNPVVADKVFFAASVFNSLTNSVMMMMPLGISTIALMEVVFKRVENFLLLSEFGQPTDKFEATELDCDHEIEPVVKMDAVCANWTTDKPTLSNISWESVGNKLTIICGSVGSGKSSFLNVLLGELPVNKGKCKIQGKISYASQDPWIFAGNIRQNILFGKPYDSARYNEAIHCCSLEEDLKQWAHGDLALVGERGVTLSGGQKARLNLARALYVDADIYLLDDPLSAVDAGVSRHVFNQAILKYLAKKMVILVTHQIQYLPFADHIIVLNLGEILSSGTYSELTEQNINFAGLIGGDDKMKDQDSAVSEIQEANASEERKPAELKEQMAGGSVTWRTYWSYAKGGNSPFYFPMIFLGFVLLHSTIIYSDFWLSYWTSAEDAHFLRDDASLTNASVNINSENFNRGNYIWVYIGLILGVCCGFALTSIVFYSYFMQVGINIHNRLFSNVVRAPIKFFEENSSGRIMNRFTKDLGLVDERLPEVIYEAIEIYLKNFSVLIILIITNYYMIFSTAFIFLLMYSTQRFFMATGLQLKRIEATTRSPVFAHLSATFEGLVTVRALKCEKILIQHFDAYQDLNTSATDVQIASTRWFQTWIQMYCTLYLVFVTFGFIFFTSSETSGSVGLGVSSALLLLSISWAMRQTAEAENLMTSVERILEYSSIESEPPLESRPELKPVDDWPTQGEIEFKNVCLSYGTTKVLKNLSFTIKSQEKIGIVGRTGAGKSSIISALFGMTEIDGEIIIDGVSIRQIGLHDLRSKISIIPQDPVLFSGSVRYNLDPFEQFEDSELWQALDDVELKNEITALDFPMETKGSNFSVGQRQLMCLARAILRKNKIIVLDEATANVDHETDSLIQKTIRDKFRECTIITIAHRLETVMDCDKILVMDNGTLMEMDEPAKLLQNSAGYLSLIVNETGKSSSERIRRMTRS